MPQKKHSAEHRNVFPEDRNDMGIRSLARHSSRSPICVGNWLPANYRAMNKPDEPDQDKPRPKPLPSEEALRIIEEYAKGLREIIKNIRQRLN